MSWKRQMFNLRMMILIDEIEIDYAETENVEQAEIQELEATDVQQTKEDIAPIDRIEIQNAETKT